MSRQCVFSDAPQGGDRVWLDGLGIVTGLTYSSTYPGGPDQASWNLLVPEAFEHRALTPGRRIEVINGASRVWRGRLQEPTPGTPWNCAAVGIGAEGTSYRAYAPTSNNALALNEVVDQAIARGLPWKRSGTLPTETGTNQGSASMTVTDALNQVADDNNLYWRVDATGSLTMGGSPPNATHLFFAVDTAGARTLNGYVTTIFVHYTDSTSKTVKTVMSSNAAAAAKFGVIEDEFDLSGVGSMSATHAQQYADSLITKIGPHTYFSDQYTATYGQLCNIGGQPVDLATAYAGMDLRVHYVAPSATGEVYPGQAADVLIGAVQYDSDNDTLTLTPVAPPSATSNPEAALTKLATANYLRYEHWQNDLALQRAAAAKAIAAMKARRKAAQEKAIAILQARTMARHKAYQHSLTTQRAHLAEHEKQIHARATQQRKHATTPQQRAAINTQEQQAIARDQARGKLITRERAASNAEYKKQMAQEKAELSKIKKGK
jgi:hypothetical protein